MTTPENARTPDHRGGETTTHHNESGATDATSGAPGEAAPRVEPSLPHERDESASSQASATEQHKAIGQQAYLDTVGPGTDTDRGPLLDAIYNEDIAPRPNDVPPRQ